MWCFSDLHQGLALMDTLTGSFHPPAPGTHLCPGGAGSGMSPCGEGSAIGYGIMAAAGEPAQETALI